MSFLVVLCAARVVSKGSPQFILFYVNFFVNILTIIPAKRNLGYLPSSVIWTRTVSQRLELILASKTTKTMEVYISRVR